MNRLGKIWNTTAPAEPFTARMISVLSGKGGVGKSVIAFNLAERIAAAGYKTLLVDADLCCGNLHILANVDPRDGLETYANEQTTLAEAVVGISNRLDLLARSQTGPIKTFESTQAIARWVGRLRGEAEPYDLVIIDHGSGISDTATVLASASDISLLVLVPELTSISDCYGLCKYLYDGNTALDCRLLINWVESEDEAEYVWTKFAAVSEKFLGRVPGLIGSIPQDNAFRRSVASQQPLAEVAPQAPVIQVLTEIARSLVSDLGLTTSGPSITTLNNEPALAEIRE